MKRRLEKNIGGVYEIFGFPPAAAVEQNGEIKMVDCHFIMVAVREKRALQLKGELEKLLTEWTEWPQDREVSYIEAGALLGDQTLAFQLFALGEVCGLWKVLTPQVVLGDHVDQKMKDELAGRGLITVRREQAGVQKPAAS